MNARKRATLTKILYSILKHKNISLMKFLREINHNNHYYNARIQEGRINIHTLFEILTHTGGKIYLKVLNKEMDIVKEVSGVNINSLEVELGRFAFDTIKNRYKSISNFRRKEGIKDGSSLIGSHLRIKNRHSFDYIINYLENLGFSVKTRVELIEY